MSAEFNWWLLIVGIVAGGALTWLVLADSSRRDEEISDEELTAEAEWIARSVGHPPMDAEVAADVLRAHRRYLGFPPPDTLVDPAELAPAGDAPAGRSGEGPAALPGEASAGRPGEGPAAPDVAETRLSG